MSDHDITTTRRSYDITIGAVRVEVTISAESLSDEHLAHQIDKDLQYALHATAAAEHAAIDTSRTHTVTTHQPSRRAQQRAQPVAYVGMPGEGNPAYDTACQNPDPTEWSTAS